MDNVFITGAEGFVGKHLIHELNKRHIAHTAGSRKIYGNIADQSNWNEILKGSNIVVHLAARVHVMNEKDSNPLEAFREVNVKGTINLAKAAKQNGVKRFIYLSSIKVNGEATDERPFSASDEMAPLDAYGISKMESELELMKLHESGVFEVVIIRPPLIYGPGVKANFEKLFWIVNKDIPIPFGKVENKRSLVSVYNLVDLIVTCFHHPNASGETFLVSDGHNYSLRKLIVEMGMVLHKHPHLISVPVGLMKFFAKLLRKESYANRLFGNLHVDTKKTCELLDWHPRYTFQDTYLKKE